MVPAPKPATPINKPVTPPSSSENAMRLNEEESVKQELLKKLEEEKKRKEAERKLRREQRLKKLEQTEEQHQPQNEVQAEPKNTEPGSGGGRILEELDREEARILAEAMTSVPDEASEALDDHDEDIQGFTEAERRSKSRRKDADVRYISLKPFFKKERKRHLQENHEVDSNGSHDVEEDEDFVKPSPVPLPDASSCKSILHRFGYSGNNEQKKSLRYADGVLPGQGSPDHHSSVSSQDISPPATPISSSR